MRVLLAPDKFKGTFSAADVCRHLRSGIIEAHPTVHVISHPLADGGEGTLDVLLSALGGDRVPVRSRGPLGDDLIAHVGRLRNGAVVVESAISCGLGLIRDEERNPMAASTYGLGLVMREVLSWSPAGILVGLGGSATVDCGLGAARALGFKLYGQGGEDLDGKGGDLERLARIEMPAHVRVMGSGSEVTALCDVRNRLVGPDGSAAIFAPQKGASPEETARLAAGLERAALIIERDLGVQVRDLRGGGAAGGLGAGMHAFLNANLIEGASEIMRLTGFQDALEGVDVVVTGEGAFDGGSRNGKVVSEVTSQCLTLGIPVVVVCGRWEAGARPSNLKVIQSKGVFTARSLREAGKKIL